MLKSLRSDWFLYLLFAGVIIMIANFFFTASPVSSSGIDTSSIDTAWTGPSLYLDETTRGEERELVIYGQDLIAHTAAYFGPKGKIARLTNGMNCQNCHLEAGAKAWGNNFGGVYSTYPKMRERSGHVESIYRRVADCMERSLNGTAIDSNSREFRAIYTYMRWLGKDVKKGVKPLGSGIEKIPFLNRAADPVQGKAVFSAKCQSCHGVEGAGQFNSDSTEYIYPPLWGAHSFNQGAGLFRISVLTSYILNNMPFNQATHIHPFLTPPEAWDVAAFIVSQPRPAMDQRHDWPDLSKKPVDYPFGPYADGFSEQQHKYGPFQPIVEKNRK